MHLVAKQVKGHEYFSLVEKARRDGRVVTARTVYIGDRQKLAEMIQFGEFPVAAHVPVAYVNLRHGAPARALDHLLASRDVVIHQNPFHLCSLS